MSIKEIENTARELQGLKRMREELDGEIAALEDRIKCSMGDRQQLIAGAFKIIWKPVASSRLDTAALRRDMPEIAERYTKATSYMRFTVN